MRDNASIVALVIAFTICMLFAKSCNVRVQDCSKHVCTALSADSRSIRNEQEVKVLEKYIKDLVDYGDCYVCHPHKQGCYRDANGDLWVR